MQIFNEQAELVLTIEVPEGGDAQYIVQGMGYNLDGTTYTMPAPPQQDTMQELLSALARVEELKQQLSL